MKLSTRTQELYRNFYAQFDGDAAAARYDFDRRLRVTFDGDWSTSFPPPVFDAAFLDLVGHASRTVLQLVFSIPKRIFNDKYADMLAWQGLSEPMAAYLAGFMRESLLAKARLYARPDMVVTTDGVKFVEMNVSPSLGGMGICNHYVANFKQDKLAHYLAQHGVTLTQPNTDDIWRKVFLQACPVRARADMKQPLLLKLLPDPGQDPDALFYAPDYVSMVEQAGYRVMTAKPPAVRADGSGVYVGGERVDVVFSDFMFCEQEQFGVPRQLIEQIVSLEEEGLVHFLSAPPACALYDNKANLAILTASEFAHLFSAAELAFIREYVPQTYVLNSQNLSLALERQSAMVLKPALGLGGSNVYFGEKMSSQEWRETLNRALQETAPFVLQELITNIGSYLPQDVPGSMQRMVCLGGYVFDGQPAGVSIRENAQPDSKAQVINVAQGATWCAALGGVVDTAG
jgi:glutathionylspermidine synthase